MFSLVFVFCDLVCGKLPWSEAARLKDKRQVASLKKQYLADPRRFVEWIKHQAEDADKLKVRSSAFSLLVGHVGSEALSVP